MTGNQSLIIGGPSMEPTLPLGSAVVIQPVAPTDISVGDIVSVKSGDGRAIYTHRVVRRLALDGVPYLETKGDNNEVADAATVPATAVIGRVMLVVPLMGFVLAWLSAVSGVAFLLGLGALLVVAAMLIDFDPGRATPKGRRRLWLVASDRWPARLATDGALGVGASLATDSSASVAALVRPGRGRPERGTTTDRSSAPIVGGGRDPRVPPL